MVNGFKNNKFLGYSLQKSHDKVVFDNAKPNNIASENTLSNQKIFFKYLYYVEINCA